ncbi:MAG: helix-turn-helix transcriptional regulator [Bryobacter sp.]|nr:helix-turn-helix transcriptional regulator [Bryobacter sp.]
MRLSRLALDCAGRSEQWQVFVEEFRQVFRATVTHFGVWSKEAAYGQINLLCGLNAEDRELWQTKWLVHDPWMAGTSLKSIPLGKAMGSQHLCGDADLEATEIYREFMEARRIHQGGGILYLSGEDAVALHTCVRPKEVGHLSEQELALWDSLVPSVQTALRVTFAMNRLELENAMMAASFEASGTGLLLLNTLGTVLRMNGAAEELLAASPHVRVEAKRLVLRDKAQQAALEEALEQFARPLFFKQQADPWKKIVVCREVGEEQSLLLLLTRLMPAQLPLMGPETPVLAAYLVDPRRPFPINQAALEQLFGLTKSELRLAEKIAEGLSVSEACAGLKISENTGRTHLKRIFAKTGVERQGELVGLLLRLSMRSGGG